MTEQEELPKWRKHLGRRIIALVLVVGIVASLGIRSAWKKSEQAEETQNEDVQPLAQTSEDQANGAVLTPPNDTVSVQHPLSSTKTTTQEDEFWQLYNEISEAVDNGDYEEALDDIAQCLERADTDEKYASALALQANAYFLSERYEESEAVYKSLLNYPETANLMSVYGMIGRCCLLQNRAEEAKDAFDKAFENLKDTDDSASLYALRGVAYQVLGDTASALTDFEEAKAHGYEDAEILDAQIEECKTLLAAAEAGTMVSTGGVAGTVTAPAPTEDEQNAAILYFSNDYSGAEALFRKLIGNSYYYSDRQLYSNIAKCQYQTSQYEGAIESCTAGLALAGTEETADLYTLRASAYMALGNSAEAGADFEAAIAAGCSDPALNALQATVCYYFSGDYERAVELGASVADQEGCQEAVLWVALSGYMLGDYPNTIVWLEKSLPLEQSYCRRDELCRLLARCNFQLSAFEEVIDAADRGIAFAAEYETADAEILQELLSLRGSARLSTGQYEAACEDLEQCQELLAEDDYSVLNQLALCCFILGKYEETADYGLRALDCGEETADLCYWIGLSQFTEEQYEESVNMLLRCLALDPERENIHFYVGVSYFSLGDYQEAISWFTESLEKEEPASARSLYNRALCYLQMDQLKQGRADLKAAAQLDDEDVVNDAKALLDSLDSLDY